jgi:hypothetical protein
MGLFVEELGEPLDAQEFEKALYDRLAGYGEGHGGGNASTIVTEPPNDATLSGPVIDPFQLITPDVNHRLQSLLIASFFESAFW